MVHETIPLKFYIEFFVFAIATFSVSLILTEYVRRYVIRKNILDKPNERSSHSVPTPRGGGLAVVCTIVTAGFVAVVGGLVSARWLPLFVATILIAWIGWRDDASGLSARFRFTMQMIIGAVILWMLAPGVVEFFGIQWTVLGPAFLFFLLFIVWLLNLYNFMDGSDGLLATQSATVSLAAAALSLYGGGQELSLVYVFVFGACLGFLKLNWSPARIFMGDVGSASLGFFFAVLAIAGAMSGSLKFVTAVILHAAFIGDATWTLFMRLLQKQRVYQAHRSHFYQKLIRLGWRHGSVAKLFAVFNICWLVPIAILFEVQFISTVPSLFLAFVPIFIICAVVRAGIESVDAKPSKVQV